MYSEAPFVLFGDVHVKTILFIVFFIVLFVYISKKFLSPKYQSWMGYLIAITLIVQESTNIGIRTLIFDMRLADHLPLHLCGISVICTAILLFNRNYFLYELTYFWGMGGAIQAIMTPDTPFGFPHILNLTFFMSHGSIILGVIFATFIFNYRPTIKSIWKTFILTNGYLLIMIPVNLILDTNYLFICEKPAGDTLLNFMGPWPWYILSLEIVAIISFFVYYSPFLVVDLLNRKKTQ